MNSQELGTALPLDLNLVVLEDRAYGMIRWKQEVEKRTYRIALNMSAVEGGADVDVPYRLIRELKFD